MKVLQVTPGYHPAHIYGGPIESVHQLCRHLGQAGCFVQVLTTDTNGADSVLNVDTRNVIAIDENLAVRYCHRVWPHTVSPALVRALPSYVRQADVIHLTSVYSFPTLPTLAICKRFDKPVVWSPRGSFQRWPGTRRARAKALWEALCRQLLPKKVMVHATSEQEAREIECRMGKIDLTVIPNGVLVPKVIHHTPRETHLRLLYIGRLHSQKGIEKLLHACRILLERRGTAWRLTIAGAGDQEYLRNLEALAASLSLAGQVTFLGMVVGNEKEKLFEDADILVHPSYSENFGLVVAEALAHGVPVIAGKGTPWFNLEAHGCGLWVDNSPESLAAAIARLDVEPLREWGERGRDWMIKEFGWEKVAVNMCALYRGLVNGSGHRLQGAT